MCARVYSGIMNSITSFMNDMTIVLLSHSSEISHNRIAIFLSTDVDSFPKSLAGRILVD